MTTNGESMGEEINAQATQKIEDDIVDQVVVRHTILMHGDGNSQMPVGPFLQAVKEELAARTIRRGGGAKTSRSESVTVRLEPRVRYLAEVAGRKQRRTLSSFVEWAIEDAFTRVVLDYDRLFDELDARSIADESEMLWDVDEPDRFVKLAIRHPDLLTHEEQKRWKLIRENGWLWRGEFTGPDKEWNWEVKEPSFLFERLRQKWDVFVAVTHGLAERSILPDWPRKEPKA